MKRIRDDYATALQGLDPDQVYAAAHIADRLTPSEGLDAKRERSSFRNNLNQRKKALQTSGEFPADPVAFVPVKGQQASPGFEGRTWWLLLAPSQRPSEEEDGKGSNVKL